MFRAISILGLCVAALIVIPIAVLFDQRIASDDSWSVAKVSFVSFLAIAAVLFLGVYIGRKREIVRQKEAATRHGNSLSPR